MSLPFNSMFPSFSLYSSREPARRVAADLRARGVTHALFHLIDDTSTGQWEMFTVDDDLLQALDRRLWHRLKLRPTVEETIRDLLAKAHERDPARRLRIMDVADVGDYIHSTRYFETPTLFRGFDGSVRGLNVGPGLVLPAERVPIYPKLTCSAGMEVAPDEVVVFSTSIDVRPPAGVSNFFQVTFPEGANTVDVIATASSEDFVSDGGNWSTTFTLRRLTGGTLECTPMSWEFRAKAIGERLRYALTIQFVVLGNVIGALQATLVRRGSGLTAKWDETPFLIPQDSGARCVLAVSSQANDHYELWAYRDGKLVARAPAVVKFEQYFEMLDLVPGSYSLDGVIQGLTNDVPAVIRDFMGAVEDEGFPLLIASVTRVAPFEIAKVRQVDPKSLLGIVHPTFRWIDAPMSDVRNVQVGRVAAIRPDYQGTNALPDAKEEEAYLRGRLSEDRVPHFATKPDVDRLLGLNDVRLLHFAGHADGSPAQLTLEDAKILATHFGPATACVLQKPFFFVNGCRAGANAGTAPSSMLGNFTKALLSQGFCGAVAPSVRVNSKAALGAARVFYDASDNNTVVQRLQKVREQGLDSDIEENMRASYLSYVVFAHADLRLTF